MHQLNDTTATGDFHVNNRNRSYFILFKDLRELVSVISGVIKFGTANKSDSSFNETVMEVGKGEGNAVSGY